MNRPAAPDGCNSFQRQPQRYGDAFLGSLDALPTNCFGFPFEQGFSQPRSSVLRAFWPARVPLPERASSSPAHRTPTELGKAVTPKRRRRHGRARSGPRRRVRRPADRRGAAEAVVVTEETSTLCPWCERPFRARRGGSPQCFCSAKHRSLFWSALRRWGERAIGAGILTIADIRNGDPVACTLLRGTIPHTRV
jgi:hypothetical protein